jgi:hypothetical protein
MQGRSWASGKGPTLTATKLLACREGVGYAGMTINLTMPLEASAGTDSSMVIDKIFILLILKYQRIILAATTV